MYYYPATAYGGIGSYPPQSQSQPQQMPVSVGLKGRPVSSVEEVRAAQIDFDGSLFVFPDIANKRIYTKQINLDGTANLNMYELAPLPSQSTQVQIQTENFVTRDEFSAAINQLKESLTQPKTESKPTPAQSTYNF